MGREEAVAWEEMGDFDSYEAPAQRFSLDNDYDGGEFGEDGEFYAMGRKKGKKQSREKALYGVFHDDSSDDDTRPHFGGGKKKGAAQVNYSAPMGFVSGGLKGQEKNDDESDDGKKKGSDDDDDDDDEDEEEARPSFGQQRGGRRGRGRGGSDDEEDEDRVSQRDPAAQLPSTFGGAPRGGLGGGGSGGRGGIGGGDAEKKKPEVDLHSMNRLRAIEGGGGVALKMLQKMGYKGGGLGASGQGIHTAIEAFKREKGEGIGVRPEKKQKVEAPKEADGKSDKEAEKEKKKKKDKARAKKEANWKVVDLGESNKPKKPKKVYKTAEEIAQEAEEAAGGQERGANVRQAAAHVSIVDMRGKEAKLVSGGDIGQSVADVDSNDAFTLPLIHNLEVLIEGAESDIFRLQRALNTESDSLVILEQERSNAQDKSDEQAYHQSRLEAIIDIVSETHHKAQSETDPLTLSALADVFGQLRGTYNTEYSLYNLASLAGPLLVLPMRRFLSDWQPLKDPSGPTQALGAWRGLLRTGGGVGEEDGDAIAYVQLVESVVIPKLLTAMAGWVPQQMTEPIVRIVECWEPLLPVKSFNTMVDTVIIPKLKACTDGWDPKRDSTPIHAWLHPWIPYIPERLEEMYPVIRYKIGVALAEWHPSDSSATAILQPWVKVFKPAHMEALLKRCVLPKLALSLREMAINPAAQQLDAFRWNIAWVGTAPIEHLAAIFEFEFFPRWLSVLFQWLTRSPDYDEVTRWYLNWKSLFPEPLATHEKVKVHFTRALDIMNNVVAGAQIVGGYLQPGTKENLDYLKVTEQRSIPATSGGAGGGGGGATGAKKDVLGGGKKAMSITDAHTDRTVSFKEALESLAEDNEVLFLPKVGRQEKGKQVYSFGGVSVYLDNRLVYVSKDGGWGPMGIEELLEMAKKKKK